MFDNKTTVKDIAGDKDSISLNFTKLNKSIEKCRADRQNMACRKVFEEIGIEIIE